MTDREQTAAAYFNLGPWSIRLSFPTPGFKETACQHIFLADAASKGLVATIAYIEDETVNDLCPESGRPNVVGIAREPGKNGSHRVILQMFDAFAVSLDFQVDKVTVRYPSHAPVRLLLDDVFQAALQPILDRLGGFVLHGACMVRSGEAIVFMGNSGTGKSTTAFNLTRFGFHCYADDAVVVTPRDKVLAVWPLSREFSLRPLSFSLFKKQAIDIGAYQREGEKYYFRQTCGNLPGARLKHICFLNLSGDAETRIVPLDRIQTRTILEENDRHFSFMGRKDAHRYAHVLSEQTPIPLTARVGTDLNCQGRVFDAFFSGQPASAFSGIKAKDPAATRSEKTDRIRKAWAGTQAASLADVIPLLGDYDPHVFKLALGFFQTLPTAKLRIVAPPPDTTPQEPLTRVPWLQAQAWHKGCGQLLTQSGLEVLQRFAYSWIVSAPVLYPFLRVRLHGDPMKAELVDQAWSRYLGSIHSTAQEAHPQPLWIATDASPDRRTAPEATPAPGKSLTIVPVFRRTKSLQAILALAESLSRKGIGVKIHRRLPLCCLRPEEARKLLFNNLFDEAGLFDTQAPLGILKSEDDVVAGSTCANRRDPSLDDRVEFQEKPFRQCHSCGLTALGLCAGGFVAQPGQEATA